MFTRYLIVCLLCCCSKLKMCEPDELLGLEDIDWDEDWSDLELCSGSDNVCCIDCERPGES